MFDRIKKPRTNNIKTQNPSARTNSRARLKLPRIPKSAKQVHTAPEGSVVDDYEVSLLQMNSDSSSLILQPPKSQIPMGTINVPETSWTPLAPTTMRASVGLQRSKPHSCIKFEPRVFRAGNHHKPPFRDFGIDSVLTSDTSSSSDCDLRASSPSFKLRDKESEIFVQGHTLADDDTFWNLSQSDRPRTNNRRLQGDALTRSRSNELREHHLILPQVSVKKDSGDQGLPVPEVVLMHSNLESRAPAHDVMIPESYDAQNVVFPQSGTSSDYAFAPVVVSPLGDGSVFEQAQDQDAEGTEIAFNFEDEKNVFRTPPLAPSVFADESDNDDKQVQPSRMSRPDSETIYSHEILQALALTSPSSKRKVQIVDDPSVRIFQRSEDERNRLFHRHGKNIGKMERSWYSKVLNFLKMNRDWETKMHEFEENVEAWSKSVHEILESEANTDEPLTPTNGLYLCTSSGNGIEPPKLLALCEVPANNVNGEESFETTDSNRCQQAHSRLERVEALRLSLCRCASLADEDVSLTSSADASTLLEDTSCTSLTEVTQSFDASLTQVSKSFEAFVDEQPTTVVFKDHPRTCLDRKKSLVSATKRWGTSRLSAGPTCETPEELSTRPSEKCEKLFNAFPVPDHLQQPVLEDPWKDDPFFDKFYAKVPSTPAPISPRNERKLRAAEPSPTSVANVLEVRHDARTGRQEVPFSPSSYEAVLRKTRKDLKRV